MNYIIVNDCGANVPMKKMEITLDMLDKFFIGKSQKKNKEKEKTDAVIADK